MEELILSTASEDSDYGLYAWQPDEIICDRYKAIGVLGDGTFGRVLEVEDL